MVVIRLSRVGKTKFPSYRIIVSDKRKDPWGDAIEVVGFYNPLAKPKVIQFKEERVIYWLSVGARPSPTVHNLLVDAKIVTGPKVRASKNVTLEAETKKAEQATIAPTPVAVPA